MRVEVGLACLLCATLLTGCGQSPTGETAPPLPVPSATQPSPSSELATLEPWQEAYIHFLQKEERERREKDQTETLGYSSIECYYLLHDIDKDGIPELLIESIELGRFFAALYTCQEGTVVQLGVPFYCGRLPAFYSCGAEPAILNDAGRADFSGEVHQWTKFTLVDGTLEEEELLDEWIPWEGEGASAVLAHALTKATDLISNAQPLAIISVFEKGEDPYLQPIFDYTEIMELS